MNDSKEIKVEAYKKKEEMNKTINLELTKQLKIKYLRTFYKR